MSATDSKTYCPMTQAGFEQIRADFAKNNVTLPDTNDSPPEGVDAGHGFTVRWHFEPAHSSQADGWLRVELSGPGWLMGTAWGAIEAHVKPYVHR